jgi:hypothetical protein
MIAEAMAAHADERGARVHPYKTIGFAARDLHACRMNLVEATLAFEAEDTPLTRRVIAEAEWRFIAARHAYYEARARALLPCQGRGRLDSSNKVAPVPVLGPGKER